MTQIRLEEVKKAAGSSAKMPLRRALSYFFGAGAKRQCPWSVVPPRRISCG